MDETTFQDVAELALNGSGQLIPPSKSYLIEARLAPILRREGLAEVSDLMGVIKARPASKLGTEAVAALTSKTTGFFTGRETLTRIVDHVLPMMAPTAADNTLRVWCAGGAAGQEACSLAILLEESDNEALEDVRVEILSTDISEAMTSAARAGQFGHFDVQKGLSIHRLLKHFSRLDTGDWQISPKLAGRIAVRTHNLLKDASGLGEFDVILCRNVISGMARPMRSRVLLNIARQLSDGGVLFLGEGETADGLVDGLKASRDVRGAFARDVERSALTAAA
ncbi:CheR family methyltransferase [Henriciella aquimarina]|uniref:CheR family methyltransferase n=1 Tax=Henriciella aquimarina TaxID=545261 RepID=UPI0009FE3CE9|nr:protein-glutamate O-methyltransferase CheR [Henriciella aquimarina]